jgi:Putative integrase
LLLTHDTSTLHQTTGYWSSETIFCNTSDEVVLLHQPTLAELQLESTSFLETVSSSVPFKSYFLQWIGKNYLGAFSLTEILNKNGGTWQHFQLNLRQKKYPKGRISRHMASLWWQHHKDLPHAAITQTTLHRLPRELSPLAIDWPFLISGGVELFFNNLIQLSQVKIQPSKQAYPNYSKLKLSEKIHISIRNLAVEEQQLVQWALPFLSENTDEKQYYHGALCAIHAATAFLSWLRCKNIIVLPLNFKNGYQWLLDFGVWPGRLLKTPEAKDAIKAGLLKFIASSSTKHIDDIPADLLIIYGSNSFYPPFYRYLADWLRHPAVERKRPVFPIDHLQKSNLVRKSHKAKWTPSWIKDNCNQEWYDFAMLWWRHPANSSHKRNILKNLLEWAWEERSFESPWEITPEDLHDPLRSEHKKTYFRFLKQKQIEDKAACWSGSSTMFRIVHQAALSPSSLVLYHGTLNDPFRTISNPFSNQRKKKHKTPRHSIPSTIHELMVDILLNPNGGIYSPSSWAKKVTQSDMVKVQDPENPKKQISTWCPSRVTCLAMLLLSPFRKVQARWLDQGLMDDECYDFTTKRMCPNQHSLRNFTYPNKNTHHQQYGRNSGVLQYSTDSIHREETLCIFVNTNKTQLWDANRISGFEVPWPDGSDLINSDDPEQQEIGKWLSRLYRVLEYQIQWMQRYDPNPNPLSPYHSHEDSGQKTDLEEVNSCLPWFVPIFRDLSLNSFISYTIEGQPHRSSLPISGAKIQNLFNQLAVETQKQFEKIYNRKIYLTVPSGNNSARKCKFDIHSLRVTWISRLYEMGIPIHIISEYIVGHASMVMTIHYLKNEITYIREKLIKAASNKDLPDGMEAFWERLQRGERTDSFLTGPNYPGDITTYLPDDFVAVVPVEGGICPMGGRGSRCREGGIICRRDNEPKKHKKRHEPVQGGCGNCRFFLTGPDFILQQLLSCNSLLLKMRATGKEEKQIYKQIDQIRHELHDLAASDLSSKHRLETEKKTCKERIHTINELLSPLCVEWVNRQEMLQESFILLKDSAESGAQQLALVGNTKLTVDDFSVEALETTEFGLVRNVIEQARLIKRQGYPLPDDASRMLREFMTIILSEHSPKNLLNRIPDEINATYAASMLAGWLSDEFGDNLIQTSIDQHKPLPMSLLQSEKLQNFTEKLITTFQKQQPLTTSSSQLDLEDIK